MSGAQLEWNWLRPPAGAGFMGPSPRIISSGFRWAGLFKRFGRALRTAGCNAHWLRLRWTRFGLPRASRSTGVDILERDIPQETSQNRALHFNKGCYLGQEIVERIRSWRGNLHRHLRPLELSGPVAAPGTALTLGEVSNTGETASAGQITSAAALPLLAGGSRAFALGMIRTEAEKSERPFVYEGDGATGTARILTSPPNLERN